MNSNMTNICLNVRSAIYNLKILAEQEDRNNTFDEMFVVEKPVLQVT